MHFQEEMMEQENILPEQKNRDFYCDKAAMEWWVILGNFAQNIAYDANVIWHVLYELNGSWNDFTDRELEAIKLSAALACLSVYGEIFCSGKKTAEDTFTEEEKKYFRNMDLIACILEEQDKRKLKKSRDGEK